MKRISLHWTGGSHTASSYDIEHYHGLVEGDGRRVNGANPPEANKAPLGSDYVRHTGGMNTDCIGLAICAMGGSDVSENPLRVGRFGPTHEQIEELALWAAEMCLIYGIDVTPDTVFLHAEVLPRWGVGVYKWDITVWPGEPDQLTAQDAGDRMRAKVLAYKNVLANGDKAPERRTGPGLFTAILEAIKGIFK